MLERQEGRRMVNNPGTTYSWACCNTPPSHNRKRWQAQCFPTPNLATEGSRIGALSTIPGQLPTPTNRIPHVQLKINQAREMPSLSLQSPQKFPSSQRDFLSLHTGTKQEDLGKLII